MKLSQLKSEKKLRIKAVKHLVRRIKTREYSLDFYRKKGFLDIADIGIATNNRERAKIKKHLQRVQEINKIFTNHTKNT